MKAYYMIDTPEGGKLRDWQQSNELLDENGNIQKVSVEELAAIGVKYTQILVEDNLLEKQLDRYSVENNYKNRDEVFVTPERMGPAVYEQKLGIFYEEHLHSDDEVRYVKNGSGYFDVRSKEDKWIRIWVEKGDLLVLPAGIYHRFITDTNDFINAIRLFKEEPKWTPINRDLPEADNHPARQEYLRTSSPSIRGFQRFMSPLKSSISRFRFW